MISYKWNFDFDFPITLGANLIWLAMSITEFLVMVYAVLSIRKYTKLLPKEEYVHLKEYQIHYALFYCVNFKMFVYRKKYN